MSEQNVMDAPSENQRIHIESPDFNDNSDGDFDGGSSDASAPGMGQSKSSRRRRRKRKGKVGAEGALGRRCSAAP